MSETRKTKDLPPKFRLVGRLCAYAIAPEWAFFVIGLIYGVVTLVVTPPFQIPDEPQHFFRAFQFSEGRFRDVVLLGSEDKSQGKVSSFGTMLPKSLAAAVESSDLASIRFRPDNKVKISRIRAGLTAPLKPGEREYLPVPSYPPGAYIPQVLGIWIGRILGLSPLFLLYLARLSALAAFLALTFIAIRATPVLKWAYFAVGLMPMTLFMAASTSSDSVILGIAFLLSATLLKWVYDPVKQVIGTPDFLVLAVLALGIALSKAVYLPLLLPYLLVPQNKFASRRICFVAFAAIAAVSVGAYFAHPDARSSGVHLAGASHRLQSSVTLAGLTHKVELAFASE